MRKTIYSMIMSGIPAIFSILAIFLVVLTLTDPIPGLGYTTAFADTGSSIGANIGTDIISDISKESASDGICLSSVTQNEKSTAHQNGTPNMRQLVIYACFADNVPADGEGLNVPDISQGTKWENVWEMLNYTGTETYHQPSLYGYLRDVSDGQCLLESVSPQYDAETGKVCPVVLPRNRAAYNSSDVLVDDLIAVFAQQYPQYRGDGLDCDGNGFIDNVLVIPEVGEELPTVGGALWPHKSDYSGTQSIGGKRIGTYTVIDSNRICGGAGTAVHETLHVLGARDLYRAGTTTDQKIDPVGVWDIMAQHAGSTLMRPLAISLQDCGWNTIGEVREGMHTLGGGSGVSAVKIFSPYSSSEYFVLEYRKADYDSGNLSALDTSSPLRPSTIGGSGLLVYRVVPRMKDEGNGNKGDRDYVYVFRDGETVNRFGERGDGAGNIRYAQLTADTFLQRNEAGIMSRPPTRNALGTDDMSKGLVDGAITHSDGQNSGIVVKIMSQTDDSITFSVSVPGKDSSFWREVPGSGTNGAGFGSDILPVSGCVDTDIEKGADGTLYQVCTMTGSFGARIFRFDGTQWSDLGIVGSGYSNFSITRCGREMYLCGTSYSGTICVWRLDGGRWVAQASVVVRSNAAVMGAVGGELYLFSDGSGSAGTLYRLSGSSLLPVASINDGYIAGACITDVEGKVAVIAGMFDRKATRIYLLDGNTWKIRELHSGCAQTVDLAAVGKNRYVLTVTDGTARIISWADGGQQKITDISRSVSDVLCADIAADGDKLYVGAIQRQTQAASVYSVPTDDLDAFKQLGMTVVRPASRVVPISFGGTVLCAAASGPDAPVLLRSIDNIDKELIAAPDPVIPTVPAESDTGSGSTASGSGSGISDTGGGTGSNSSTAGSNGNSIGTGSSPATGTASAAKPTQGATSISSANAKIAKPGKVALKKVRAAKKSVSVSWKKLKKNVSGYQICWSNTKTFKKCNSKKIGLKKSSYKISKLKSKKTYYVKVRAYKKVHEKYYYGKWSVIKKVRTK